MTPQGLIEYGLERSGRTEPELIEPSERPDWMSDQEWADFQAFEDWAATVNGLRIER